MTPDSYRPGQRWVSNTEPELGLGIVESTQARRVTVFFSAAEEHRTYAVDNAPISRVRYSVDEQISTNDDRAFKITHRREVDGCFVYEGVDSDGDDVTVNEAELTSAVQFSRPEDRLFAGQIDHKNLFELRADTVSFRQRHRQSPVYGLIGARVQLLPHQLYIAHQVGARHAPRVLLADEVGLGKTIEAGLIVHQQLLNGRAERVLVVVPESLTHQWLIEMRRRFNLPFTLLDEQRCIDLEEAGEDNPFSSAALILCSLDLLTGRSERHAQALRAPWDVIVVDEAHHLAWTQSGASTAYQVVESLGQAAPGLILLTATPEQLGMDGHFSRLRLLDCERYHDIEQFRREEADYDLIARVVEDMMSAEPGDAAHHVESLTPIIGTDATQSMTSRLTESAHDGAIESAIDQLLDRHGTGRVMFRNTRDAVGGFTSRRLHAYPLAAAPDASGFTEDNPKFGWLLDWLKTHRGERLLVIVAGMDDARELEKLLRLRGGVRSAVFHEEMSLINRDRAAAYFAEPDEGAQVLVCSEIGSEGRNFQFAHHLALLDLPDNPDLLEQRIGRLDRIGQREPVDVHVPYHPSTAEEVLLRWYHDGIDAFERPGPGGDRLLRELGGALEQCLHSAFESAEVEALVQRTRQLSDEMRTMLDQGRNRLLELNSCHPRRSREVAGMVADAAHTLELADYMERVFDRFGIDHQAHCADSIVLHPTDHMLESSFPALPEDGVTATYSRRVALAREDMQFLSWEHPMVTGAMDMIANGEFGNTALCTAKLRGVPAGTLLLESIHTLHCMAPAALGVERFAPQAMLRLLVDVNGNDLSARIPPATLNTLTERVPGRTAEELVRHARQVIGTILERNSELAQAQRDQLVEQALKQLQVQRGTDQRRLEELASVNPTIRPEEIEEHRSMTTTLHGYLAGAELRLDALRVVIAI